MSAPKDNKGIVVDENVLASLLGEPRTPVKQAAREVMSAPTLAGPPAPVAVEPPPDPPREAAPAEEPSPLADPVQEDFAAIHRAAEQSFRAGEFEQAADGFNRVIAEDPGSPSARFNLGLCLERLGRSSEAAEVFAASVQLASAEPSAQIALGVCRLRSGDPVGALEAFDAALTDAPAELQAAIGRSAALLRLKRFSEARACCESAQTAHSDSVELQEVLATAVHALGDFDAASEIATRLLELAPKSAVGIGIEARLARSSGDHESAARWNAKLVDLEPSSYQVWFNLGEACQQTGRLDVACDAYRQALQIKQTGWEAHANLGATLQEMDDPDAAAQAYVSALRHAPEQPGVLWNLAVLAESSGSANEAEHYFGRALAQRPDWKEAHARRAQLC